MKIIPGPLKGLLIIEPKVTSDNRGYFFELYHQKKYSEYGIPDFVQDNHSVSKANVVRGLHYQIPDAQGKLVGVTHGKVMDVAVDLRRSSPTFSKWFSIILDAESHKQMYIPPGFAHGFCVLSDSAGFYYKCSEFYNPHAESGIAWDDATINVQWPVKNPILSEKDLQNPTLNETSHEKLYA